MIFSACALILLGFWSGGFIRPWGNRILFLEIPLGVMVLLAIHSRWILHPQISDLQRRIADPKFAGTAHLEKLRTCFARLHKRSVQLRGVILFLGWFSLGLLPRLL